MARKFWQRQRLCQLCVSRALNAEGKRRRGQPQPPRDFKLDYQPISPGKSMIRVRLKIIGNLETMHDSDLPTVLIISLPIIFKRTVVLLSWEGGDEGQVNSRGR